MYKFLIGFAAAASAVTMAAPASAQVWAPPVYNYNPYNYTHGFNARGFAQTMEARVQRMRSDVRVMEARRVLSRGEARNLDRQARNLQDRIYRVSRYGVTPGEARSVENQIRRLEVRISREATDWNNRYGRHHRW